MMNKPKPTYCHRCGFKFDDPYKYFTPKPK